MYAVVYAFDTTFISWAPNLTWENIYKPYNQYGRYNQSLVPVNSNNFPAY